MRRWLSALGVLILLGLAARALWIESAKFRVERVPQVSPSPSRLPSVLPAGDAVLLSLVRLQDVAPGDVILFRHALDVSHPTFARVGEMTRIPGGTGYLVKLESGDASREPWHAELHVAAWRVVVNAPMPIVAGEADLPTAGAAVLLAAAGCSLLAIGARIVRRALVDRSRTAVARSYWANAAETRAR